jgi:hypothetical protein
MLTITDSGCHKHQSRKITFEGSQATMMKNFVTNLPFNAGNYTYICKWGHTHQIILYPSQAKATSCLQRHGYADLAAPDL